MQLPAENFHYPFELIYQEMLLNLPLEGRERFNDLQELNPSAAALA